MASRNVLSRDMEAIAASPSVTCTAAVPLTPRSITIKSILSSSNPILIEKHTLSVLENACVRVQVFAASRCESQKLSHPPASRRLP